MAALALSAMATASMRSISTLRGINVDCCTPIALCSLFEGTKDDRTDPSNNSQNLITVAHEIRKIFLVSDNQAFNRLFSFVGHRTINEAMWNLGLQSTRLHHRLSETRSIAANLYSEPVDVNVAVTALTLLPKRSGLALQDNSGLPGVKVGTAYVADDGRVVSEPMDFSKKNYMSLMDQQDLLIKLVRPDILADSSGLSLDTAMRMFLMEAMAQFPSQSANPKYDGSDYPDDYCKFFLPGLSRIRPKGALRIFNKIGRAYGFTIDNSYVFDVETGRSFFLTAVLYTNANGVLNDDQYEYEFADRIFADLAEVLGRALWQIPDYSTTSSNSLDCTPSSLWEKFSKPLMTSASCQTNVFVQRTQDSDLPAMEKTHVIGQPLIQLALHEERHSLPPKSHGQGLCEQISSNPVVSKAVALCGTNAKQSNSNCSSVILPAATKPMEGYETSFSCVRDQQCNSSDIVLPMMQLSSCDVVSTSICAKVFNRSVKSCYKYFLDE